MTPELHPVSSTTRPAADVPKIHIGSGEPLHAWIEGRNYVVIDVCERHGLEIVEEPGGPDMPTVHGRRYCPACQAELNAALDEQ